MSRRSRQFAVSVVLLVCGLLATACGNNRAEGVVDWGVGPVKFSLNSSGKIDVSAQKRWVTPLGTFSAGGKVGREAGDSEIILVIRHRTPGGVVDDAYRVPTSADVRILVNGRTELGIRGRTVTVDASNGDIKEISLVGVTWLMPDLRGDSLQTAQSRLENMTDGALSYSSTYDASGRGDSVTFDALWTVCSQSIPPGATVTADSYVGLGIVSTSLSCPDASPAPTAAVWTMPSLIGVNVEDAHDQLAELSNDQIELINMHDASGAGNDPSVSSDWKVCSQRPVPRSTVTAATPIQFGVIETERPCPAVAW